ncbi:MAG: hypothetical protein K2Y42_06170 [Hyphomicrobium sp.]|jgi:hypothetical protein|uniref:hypothetical protein n=1 Tax=Hyphomicrobium sp. TaxID=82 RepID=UPI0025C6D023|nr:hypothetical protein [Hyphomicrobium sp.]MBX9862322.1 hypothetical protein [Hyphomicrobium sp.]
MLVKPPAPQDGEEGLRAFRNGLKLSEASLRSKAMREFYRRDLKRREQLYETLAKKRPPRSSAALHFIRLSAICRELLHEFGEEPPSQPRPRKPHRRAALAYPVFPEDLTHRIHFFEGHALRRLRAVQLASHADAVFRQTSGTGKVLVSVGVGRAGGQLFERLIHALGDSGIEGDLEKAGFETGYVYRPPDAGPEWTFTPPDPSLPLARIWSDNNLARRYQWQARILAVENGQSLPEDLPAIPESLPWDPDPAFQRILNLTHENRLHEALALVEEIPASEREALFDEVVYLRFLAGSPVRASDIRHLASKHISASTIAGRLSEEFNAFIDCLDDILAAERPPLNDISRLTHEFGDGMIPRPPPAKDWPATRCYYEGASARGALRGRIFIYNIDIGDGSLAAFFAPFMVAAEDAFRRARAIPEIGRGWASEVALFDLVRTLWPTAQHQWRPPFLGMQSIDVYVPDLHLAIEYQGQQHFEPVDLFGGEEGFRATSARDARKRALLSANGVRLIEWRYDVAVTRGALVRALEAAGIAASNP